MPNMPGAGSAGGGTTVKTSPTTKTANPNPTTPTTNTTTGVSGTKTTTTLGTNDNGTKTYTIKPLNPSTPTYTVPTLDPGFSVPTPHGPMTIASPSTPPPVVDPGFYTPPDLGTNALNPVAAPVGEKPTYAPMSFAPFTPTPISIPTPPVGEKPTYAPMSFTPTTLGAEALSPTDQQLKLDTVTKANDLAKMWSDLTKRSSEALAGGGLARSSVAGETMGEAGLQALGTISQDKTDLAKEAADTAEVLRKEGFANYLDIMTSVADGTISEDQIAPLMDAARTGNWSGLTSIWNAAAAAKAAKAVTTPTIGHYPDLGSMSAAVSAAHLAGQAVVTTYNAADGSYDVNPLQYVDPLTGATSIAKFSTTKDANDFSNLIQEAGNKKLTSTYNAATHTVTYAISDQPFDSTAETMTIGDNGMVTYSPKAAVTPVDGEEPVTDPIVKKLSDAMATTTDYGDLGANDYSDWKKTLYTNKGSSLNQDALPAVQQAASLGNTEAQTDLTTLITQAPPIDGTAGSSSDAYTALYDSGNSDAGWNVTDTAIPNLTEAGLKQLESDYPNLGGISTNEATRIKNLISTTRASRIAWTKSYLQNLPLTDPQKVQVLTSIGVDKAYWPANLKTLAPANNTTSTSTGVNVVNTNAPIGPQTPIIPPITQMPTTIPGPTTPTVIPRTTTPTVPGTGRSFPGMI